MSDKLVLIIDDEPGILATLSGVLNDEGYRTLTAQSGEEAVSLYRDHRPDVVFLDIWLPDRDGLETLEALREADPAAAVVMMSGHGTAATAVKAIKMGACDYVEKPLSYAQAVAAAEGACRFREKASAEGLLAATAALRETRSDSDRHLAPPPETPLLRLSREPQRT
ncbi:MAG TPA: response regulator, partial [Thermoanaerobaculia bacterium]|nr:response regulator [Thermoanaerobaculia bacterium]